MENKTFSERLNLICKGSRWKRIDDGAIGTVLEVCDDNSNNLVVRWTHPNIEGSMAGTYDRYEFCRKWVPIESYQDNNPIKGSIWKSKTSNEYVRIELIAEGLIYFRPLTNNKSPRDVESMCRKRFLEDFKFEKDDDTLALYGSDDDENKLAIVTGHGSYPERLVCKFINMEKLESHTRVVGLIQFYHHYHLLSLDSLHEYRIIHNSIEAIEQLKEGESKMENSKETYLKTDESKMKEFSSGAKREDKFGKGRYDLIPGDIMADFINYAWEAYFIEGPTTICDTDISLNAYFDDVTDEKLFFEFILNMTCMFFTDHEKLDEITDSVGERAYVVTWEDFHTALYKMRELLAKHYEAGAKVHGVNNWKKGIPVSDSERGGNFVDSMRRHTDQALRGLDDEPHAISAIWNAFCAIWTIRNCK